MCIITWDVHIINNQSRNFVIAGGYSIESLLETKDSPVSIPIPLPVYIRTRSPPGSDVFGKPKRCRRSRTVFTELQLMGLEKRFETQKYLSTPDRMDLADSLGESNPLFFAMIIMRGSRGGTGGPVPP